MTLPNFLVIGAAKSGTTSLHYLLGQHPQVFMCPEKEIGFFWAYGENVVLKGPGSEKLRHRLVDDLGRYQNFFKAVTNQTAIGESSVRYLTSPHAPHTIHRFIPQARLVAILRQPAERAYSAFLHNLRDGLEPCKDFTTAIAQERDGLRDDWMFCRYLKQGFYAECLSRYLQVFPDGQMFIALFDDLLQNAQGLVAKLFLYLGVDDSFAVDASKPANVSGVIRNPFLRLIWTRSNRLRATLRPWIDPRVRHSTFEWLIRDLYKPVYPPEIRAELTKFYRQDILQLQDILGRDLSHWMDNPTS